MISFALALVASLAAAQTYEESYAGSASIADVGTTDVTIAFKVQVEETTDKLTTTAYSEVTWEVVLEGADIATDDFIQAYTCFEYEACVLIDFSDDELTVYYTERNGSILPSTNCNDYSAQPLDAFYEVGIVSVASSNGTSVTESNANITPYLVPQTLTFSGKTISMSAKHSTSEVIDLAAIR